MRSSIFIRIHQFVCVHMHASNEAYVGFHSGVISLHERILQFPSPFPILITRNSQLSFPGAHLTSHSFKDDIKAVDMIFSHLLMRLLALCVRVSARESFVFLISSRNVVHIRTDEL